MSTRNTDIDKDQEASGGAPGTIYSEDTLKLEKMSPTENVPQPPQHPSRNRRGFWFAIAAVVIVLALVFSVFAVFIAQPGKSPSTKVTPTATAPGTTTTPGSDTTPSPAPGVIQGPQNGPAGVNTAAYWDTILGTKGTNGKVESVSFANVMGNSTLQALVTVRHSDANSTLDVYVFDKVTSKNPAQIFNLNGLIKGEAKISYYNSIMATEVDQNSTLNTGKTVSQVTPDLFREFAWNHGSMSQVAFPGIFPDLTRYQAEADQTLVNKRQDTWKNDPQAVAKALALEPQLLNWHGTLTTRLLSGGGPQDVYATVQVQKAPIQNSLPSIVVTLSRLEGNTHNMWVAIGVADGSMLTLKNLAPRQSISSPVMIEGTGAAFEALIGQAVVYDHLYTDIGHARIIGSNGMGEGTYTTQVSYTSSFHGVQEGMVTVYENNGGLSDENATAVMMKVLINPTPSTSILDPAYWTQFVSVPPDIRVANSVSFGQLVGKPSLQAVVVATDILGGGPVYRDVFVFDKINDPHPQLLWHASRLLHGDARTSGFSTVITAQVDVNSSINKGKLEGAWTNDLFREFKWSSKSGTFVQVVLPGMFPDMTRWQAEADQALVNAGSDSWKLDAVQTTQHALKFLNRSATNPLTLVSGGGPNDPTATVRAEMFPQGGGPATTTITLKRLEGGNVKGGIWEITAVESVDFGITSPASGPSTLIKSPVTVKGYGWQYEGEVGNVVIQDHLYTEIGREIARGTGGMTKSSFTIDVPYTSSFKGGAQEGILMLNENSGAGTPVVVMEKVLITG